MGCLCPPGCQIEREGEMGCLCPPGLHLASDNRSCKGDPSFLVLPYPNFQCVKHSLNLHHRHFFVLFIMYYVVGRVIIYEIGQIECND